MNSSMRAKIMCSISISYCTMIITAFTQSTSNVVNLAPGGRVRIETYLTCEGDESDSITYSQCPLNRYRFPDNIQATNSMIRVKTPIPPLENGTICTWVTLGVNGMFQGTLASYSVGTNYNSFAILYESYDTKRRFRMFLNSPGLGGSVNMPLLKKNLAHLCVSFSTVGGYISLYVDGKFQNKKKFSDARPLQGGGIYIVGQDQDTLAGGFDPDQALKGTITNYLFWKRELTSREIEDMAKKCICPSDVMFTLDPEDIILSGNVTAIPIRQCPTVP